MSQFEAYSHDLETNVPFRTSYTVKHQRYTKNGIVELVSDQDIGEVQKARNSKEVRNAILSQIPDYVRDEAIKIIKRTLHQAVQDIPGAWNSIKAKFALMGVSPASLCRFINKPLNKTPDCLDAADIVEFRFLYDAIKNDKSVLDETFSRARQVEDPRTTSEEGGRVIDTRDEINRDNIEAQRTYAEFLTKARIIEPTEHPGVFKLTSYQQALCNQLFRDIERYSGWRSKATGKPIPDQCISGTTYKRDGKPIDPRQVWIEYDEYEIVSPEVERAYIEAARAIGSRLGDIGRGARLTGGHESEFRFYRGADLGSDGDRGTDGLQPNRRERRKLDALGRRKPKPVRERGRINPRTRGR